MRAFLTITLVTASAAARGREIYRNVTSKRERCFEGSRTGRPAQRRPKKSNPARMSKNRIRRY